MEGEERQTGSRLARPLKVAVQSQRRYERDSDSGVIQLGQTRTPTISLVI